ncbi:hypothetical protein [Deinococcus humi]|uniref:Uncharacterized protein n=1 Tax=Deinococcus humi TaxID=662880 RepID=A0A7W8JWL9_9DEIO|nr:hypothetical protein [Deinococcus humi]MBB5364602.1 hypothetical protein [Deinococcus humi]GGO39230.1 hypothetical protein GCM10008949_46990 [Deinococcus humi]
MLGRSSEAKIYAAQDLSLKARASWPSDANVVGVAKAKSAYMVDVASLQHGVGFGPWTRMSGFSEQ